MNAPARIRTTEPMQQLIDQLADRLVKEQAASRVQGKDASLYGFSAAAQECAANFMGWADLASMPPCPIQAIQDFAQEQLWNGVSTVILVGQGGSAQAPMTIARYCEATTSAVSFRVLDSDSPICLREVLADIDPHELLVVVSSKSGGTIEPRLALRALRGQLKSVLSEDELVSRLVAVTDPGSDLERQARDEGWAAVFPGEPTVGGRFSALSVFGLLPAALMGIDLQGFVASAREAELSCSQDFADNPAIQLAAFLCAAWQQGRDKLAFLAPPSSRALGLWIEQLVAESLGKDGRGILPYREPDTLLLSHDAGDRMAVAYETAADSPDELQNYRVGLQCMDVDIPRMNLRVESVEDLAAHFVLWEYAVALCGYLMKVCPFDQPDVASAKAAVLSILRDGQPAPAFTEPYRVGAALLGDVEVQLAPCFASASTVREALAALLGSIRPGDFFAVNAFLPLTGEGRRESLETLRRSVAAAKGTAACLEEGPRYLHSIGQLQKGGPNNGVYLVLSADESYDILLEQEAASMGALAKAQAAGDASALAARGRRVVHVHLPSNAGIALRALADMVQEILREGSGNTD